MRSFTIYEEYYDLITLLPTVEEQEELLYQITRYMFEGIEPTLNEAQTKIFKNLKRPLDKSKNNSLRSIGKGAPDGNQNAQKANQKQTKNKPEHLEKTNQTSSKKQTGASRKNKPNEFEKTNTSNDVYVNVNVNGNVDVNNKTKKEKYGKYGRVKLTIDEYLRLVNEFGEDFIKEQIDLLDEYVESNNNKNKYTNFNLVLRRAIKGNWFKNKTNGGSSSFMETMKEIYDEQRGNNQSNNNTQI